MACEPQYF
jgi:hypothetical protein